MSKNNVKIITPDELAYLNSRYEFEIMGKNILVKIKNYNRVTAHPLNKSFSLNTKVRKVTITAEVIKVWHESFKDRYSLFDVQNAVNILIATYQLPSVEEILRQLRDNTINTIRKV